MNIRRQAKALASSLLVLAGLNGAANAQYHVNEITPGVPILRVHPKPRPRFEPQRVRSGDDHLRSRADPADDRESRRPPPAPGDPRRPGGQSRPTTRTPRRDQGQTSPGAGARGPRNRVSQSASSARHAQIARRMAYNDRVKTRSEMELDYIQANMWWNLCMQPELSPWKLLMDSATVYGWQGYGYGVQNRPYPVYGLGGPGCVPMSGY